VSVGAAEEVAVATAVLMTVGGVTFSVTGGVACGGVAVVLAVGVRGGALVIVAVTVAVGRCPSSSSEHPATAVNATAIVNPRKIRLRIWKTPRIHPPYAGRRFRSTATVLRAYFLTFTT
jgi:hypothetical protein